MPQARRWSSWQAWSSSAPCTSRMVTVAAEGCEETPWAMERAYRLRHLKVSTLACGFGAGVSKWLALAALVALVWVARAVLPPFIVAGMLAYILSRAGPSTTPTPPRHHRSCYRAKRTSLLDEVWGGGGEGEVEGRPAARAMAFYPDLTAVGQHQVLGYRQPQACSGPRCPHPRRVGLVKALEHSRKVFGLDADARIRDPQLDPLTAPSGAGLDTTRGGREFGGVAQQIREHLSDAPRIGTYPQLVA